MSRACLVFFVDLSFLQGFKVLCYSLMKRSNIWSLPKVVLTFSDEVRRDGFVNRHADVCEIPASFLEELEMFPISFDRPLPNVEVNRAAFIARQRNTFAKLFAISDFGYKKNIFIDADIICLNDISDLLEMTDDADFLAAPALLKHHIRDDVGNLLRTDQRDGLITGHLDADHKGINFNSGVFVANKKVLGTKSIETLLKIGKAAAHTGDQPIYNKFISESGLSYRNLTPWFNMERPYFYVLGKIGFLECRNKIRLVHFTGMKKPWWPYSGKENEVAGVEFLYQEWQRLSDQNNEVDW